MASASAAILAAMMIGALALLWQQSNPLLSRSHQRFHYRTDGSAPPSIIALRYSDEVLGVSHPLFNRRYPAVPLRLDYHHSAAQTADERRMVLCVFWPEISPLFPDFPFEKVCR